MIPGNKKRNNGGYKGRNVRKTTTPKEKTQKKKTNEKMKEM